MNIEKQIEFDKIKNMWCKFAVTDAARERIAESSLIYSETELRKNLRDTTDARELIEKLGIPPLQNISEVKEVLVVAERGDCLSAYQLERVEVVLVAVKRLKGYLERGKVYLNSIAYYEENLDPVEELREEISRQIRNGGVDDYASRELSQIRMKIQRTEEEMKQKAEQIMRTHKDCMADSYYTMRNGRVCVPVKKECKLKIAGSVIDKSATGSTFFIEPAGVAKIYEELYLLKLDEENEVYRILYTLSAMVMASADVVLEDLTMIEKLDYMFSKGKLSLDMGAVEPSINVERRIHLVEARHPLMEKEIAVPLQFEIGNDIRGIVITGPNTGGKTVAIKTVMLNCMMAQYGLHVTCKQADICMNSAYLCDIGDGQNLSENLSTFSAHITNVLEILSEANANSFIIMDELGSGTDPAEGMGIAIAILEELRKSGSLFLVTTHYPEVKEYAAGTDGILNARMEFDRDSLCPTYQMIIGEAGESCAFYIADRLGMPNEMLRVAIAAAYGEDAVEDYNFQKPDAALARKSGAKLTRTKTTKKHADLQTKYQIGDSVMIFPEKKIGIVCEPINERGVLRVQLPNRKIWINHKRVKLHVAATQLYPEDYDFSILFDTVENRKKRHDMERKYTEDVIEQKE
ncbi:MAG: DNA mismatch repair protein MutS [Acetatifactor sp.]